MKTKTTILQQVCRIASRPFVWAVPAILFLLQLGCATQKPIGLTLNSPPVSQEILANLGTVGIISTSTVPKLSIQRPLTKEQALSEARDDAEYIWEKAFAQPPEQWLRYDPVAAAVIAAMTMPIVVPVSLTGQTMGGVKGMTEKNLRESDEVITKLAGEVELQENLRQQTLRKIKIFTDYPVVLVEKPFPKDNKKEFSQMSCVMAGTLAWIPSGQTPAYYLTSHGIDTALEIQLLHPALKAEGIVNPLMALNAEIRVRLVRVREGKEIYSSSMNYRSAERKFSEWASNNGQPLRDELESLYQNVSSRIIEQLSIPTWSVRKPMNLVSTFEK